MVIYGEYIHILSTPNYKKYKIYKFLLQLNKKHAKINIVDIIFALAHMFLQRKFMQGTSQNALIVLAFSFFQGFV